MSRVQRETQLLDIAEEVFVAKGFVDSTMEDIADRAGITKPVIYDHFGSKDGLLAAAIARSRRQLFDSTAGAWDAVASDASPEERLGVGLRSFFAFIADHAEAFALIQQEGALSAPLAKGLEDIRAEQARVVGRVLRQRREIATVPAALVEGFAEVVIATAERVAVWRLKRPEISLDDATDIVMTVVWRGLASVTG